MIAESVRFTMVREVMAPRERVFRAWTGRDDWLRPARLAYRELVAPRRLVVAAVGDGDEANAPLAAVVFAERGDRTEITLAASAPEDEADELEEAWSAMLDRLVEAVTPPRTLLASPAGRSG